MIKFLLLIAGCVLMYRIADADDNASPVMWIVITFLLGIASFFLLPEWPMFRIGLAVIASFIAMIVWNVVTDS